MSELRKENPDQIYYITIKVVGDIDVFTHSEYVKIIVRNLMCYQKNKGLRIYAYVVMTSHIHLVLSQTEGQLDEVIMEFKNFTAKELLKAIHENQLEKRRQWIMNLFEYYAKELKQDQEYVFWNKSNNPVELFSKNEISEKIDLIHNIPLVEGFVWEAEKYFHSSANSSSPIILDEC